jgi:hypothetical protein
MTAAHQSDHTRRLSRRRDAKAPDENSGACSGPLDPSVADRPADFVAVLVDLERDLRRPASHAPRSLRFGRFSIAKANIAATGMPVKTSACHVKVRVALSSHENAIAARSAMSAIQVGSR